MSMSRRVLITGASGLLGRHVYREFQGDPTWETLGVAYSRAKGDLRKLDLTDGQQVRSLLKEYKPTVIVHCAAERRPEVVENQEAATKTINVDATRTIVEEAANIGAIVLYISTDYVFDGSTPPYEVHDKPNPLNKYGQSKLNGEEVVLETNKDNLVFRVPILYGHVEYLDESAVTLLFSKVKDTSKDCVMSDYERRYPTHCADIAWVIRELVDKRLKDSSLTGTFHWSGDENLTKYDMAIIMADAFNIPKGHIKADKTPSGGAKRPYDAHLSPSRIEAVGICKRTPFKEGIEACLAPYV